MAGSIEKRGENTWRLVVSAGYDIYGKRIRHRKTIQAKSEKEAQKLLDKFVEEIEMGKYNELNKMNFSDFIDKWLEDFAEKNLAPKTIESYKYEIECRIKPALGHIKLNQLKPMHLIDFYNNLGENGIRRDGKKGPLSSRTIQYNHRIISSILQDAVEWQIIFENPASRVAAPKNKTIEAKYYTDDQAKELLKILFAGYADNSIKLKYIVGVCISLTGGLRLGEILGLEWDDIDYDNNIIKIKRAGQLINDIGMITVPTKTKKSFRKVPLPKFVFELIKKYKAVQNGEKLKLGNLWVDSNRLFTQWNGEPMYYTTFPNWFRKFFLKHKELPRISFHSLRHSAATILINKDLNLKAVQDLLGHEKGSTTVNIYSHAIEKVTNKSAEIMSEVFTDVVPEELKNIPETEEKKSV